MVSKASYETINLKEYVIEFRILMVNYNTLVLEPSDFGIFVEKNNIDNFHDIYRYLFNFDEQGNLYVEVEKNNEVIGAIDYNEFIDSLKNKQYEKLVTCTFSTFHPNNEKGKY